MFVPVVDGRFIAERPTITMDRQQVNGVSLLVVLFVTTWFIYTCFLQDVLLAVTNTLEGFVFALPIATNTTDFVRQLFPNFSAKQADEAVSYYTALNATMPTVSDQTVAIMSECSHFPLIICKGSH